MVVKYIWQNNFVKARNTVLNGEYEELKVASSTSVLPNRYPIWLIICLSHTAVFCKNVALS